MRATHLNPYQELIQWLVDPHVSGIIARIKYLHAKLMVSTLDPASIRSALVTTCERNSPWFSYLFLIAILFVSIIYFFIKKNINSLMCASLHSSRVVMTFGLWMLMRILNVLWKKKINLFYSTMALEENKHIFFTITNTIFLGQGIEMILVFVFF